MQRINHLLPRSRDLYAWGGNDGELESRAGREVVEGTGEELVEGTEGTERESERENRQQQTSGGVRATVYNSNARMYVLVCVCFGVDGCGRVYVCLVCADTGVHA